MGCEVVQKGWLGDNCVVPQRTWALQNSVWVTHEKEEESGRQKMGWVNSLGKNTTLSLGLSTGVWTTEVEWKDDFPGPCQELLKAEVFIQGKWVRAVGWRSGKQGEKGRGREEHSQSMLRRRGSSWDQDDRAVGMQWLSQLPEGTSANMPHSGASALFTFNCWVIIQDQLASEFLGGCCFILFVLFLGGVRGSVFLFVCCCCFCFCFVKNKEAVLGETFQNERRWKKGAQ